MKRKNTLTWDPFLIFLIPWYTGPNPDFKAQYISYQSSRKILEIPSKLVSFGVFVIEKISKLTLKTLKHRILIKTSCGAFLVPILGKQTCKEYCKRRDNYCYDFVNVFSTFTAFTIMGTISFNKFLFPAEKILEINPGLENLSCVTGSGSGSGSGVGGVGGGGGGWRWQWLSS
uniref:Uncharacterized protein n=1 Tax=Glossina palpalis gambiensis TaxID=67801 RepID=A0A1B0BQ37_9MUSC